MDHPFYARFPHSHGDMVTFTAEDDIWLAPLGGGRAWRVSTDHVPVSTPRLSPDGARIAWTSRRGDTTEVYTAPSAGGPATRLTHWSARETSVYGWLSPDEVLVLAAHDQPAIRRTWAWAVPLDGGPARRLPYGAVSGAAYGPDGGVLVITPAMSRGRDAARWKRYRGGMAGRLWIDRDGSGDFTRVHADLDGNLEFPLWVGERIAFLSDHEGIGAVYSSLPDGSGLRRHTPLETYAREAATDGVRVTYMTRGQLRVLDSLDGPDDTRPRHPAITLGGSRTARRPHPVSAADHLGTFSPDTTGRATAVETRGTLHWLTHRDGPVRALAAEPGVRARLPLTFSRDGAEHVLWVTDARGDDALALRAAAPRDGEPVADARLFAAGELGRVHELAVAPDGTLIAAASHDGRVLLVEPDSGLVTELDRSSHDHATGLAFSPDSAWLAWSHAGPLPLRQLRMAHVRGPQDDRAVTDVTPLRFIDHEPVFTRDGRHLAFLSERSFEPVYDSVVFDVGFPAAARPWLLPLAATTPSPFGPFRDGYAPAADAADAADAGDAGGGPAAVTVDLDGLHERAVPFPVETGRYSSLRAYADGLLWLRHPVRDYDGIRLGLGTGTRATRTLERFRTDTLEHGELATEISGFEVSGDGTRLVARTGEGLRELSATGPAPAEPRDLDLGRVRVTVDPPAEWRQMYDEAGRLMRDKFWRADMGGVNWAATLDAYRPLLDALGSRDDLFDLLWEVQGELGTSHAYVVPPEPPAPAHGRDGLLGAELTRDAEGVWRVVRVLPGEPADPAARSPLAAPGVGVRPGDALLAVDGHPVPAATGPLPLLTGTADRPVELTIGPAAGGGPRHVVVVPLATESPLRYHEWVAGRRAETARLSGGRLGYLHMPDMMIAGWAQLHRDLRTQMAYEGLIVDARFNGGGHLSELVVEKLSRQLMGWKVPRVGEPRTYPLDTPRGPVVMLGDENSGSDGDQVLAAARIRGFAPVVGARSWGGLVGIDMRYTLVDGTLVTQPTFASHLEGGFGYGVENHGTEPDTEVVIRPQDRAAGEDPQLAEAVGQALAALERRPAAVPPPLPDSAPRR
ncbi:S41 family peptidase [Streptomyces avicenniae]|uniref:S41 family peptidase n=1 Tax=Streptomyces avicenniae TaxID=500153 RepID=UPI000699B0CC|nr:S41 family peptidase [Streptomyces avicenniae]